MNGREDQRTQSRKPATMPVKALISTGLGNRAYPEGVEPSRSNARCVSCSREISCPEFNPGKKAERTLPVKR